MESLGARVGELSILEGDPRASAASDNPWMPGPHPPTDPTSSPELRAAQAGPTDRGGARRDSRCGMKAIVLAAGRGARMRPLTDSTPKPLLEVGGRPLIEWHLAALARAGVREVVVNTAWHEAQIVARLGDGARFGLTIRYSLEGRDHGGALETAGGIATALPLLVDHADDPFWIVSADIWAPGFGFDPDAAARFADDAKSDAHLWLVPNPDYHPRGDFRLDVEGKARLADDALPAADQGRRPAFSAQPTATRTWTYANLALGRPTLVAGVAPGTRAPLGPRLFDAARCGRITAERWEGEWENVGTPAQLEALAGRVAAAEAGARPRPPVSLIPPAAG